MFFIDSSSKTIEDKTSKLEPSYKQNRKYIQYLGFEFDLTDINIRSGTIAKHYRRFKLKIGHEEKNEESKPRSKSGYKQKRQDRFAYMKQAIGRINGNGRLESQLKNIRRREKKLRASSEEKQST